MDPLIFEFFLLPSSTKTRTNQNRRRRVSHIFEIHDLPTVYCYSPLVSKWWISFISVKTLPFPLTLCNIIPYDKYKCTLMQNM